MTIQTRIDDALDEEGYDTAAAVRAFHGRISDMTLWRWIHNGTFPPPDRIIKRRRFWHRRHRKLAIGDKVASHG